jgi:hypothetical protein
MALIPELDLQVQDGGLGLLPANVSGVQVKLGVCSASAERAGEIVVISGIEQLKSALGSGPLVDAAAQVLVTAGGPVICVPLRASIPGVVGEVTSIANGEGTFDVDVVPGADGPRDGYALVVQITQEAPTIDEGAFRYSLDGGRTWSVERAIVPSFVVPGTDLVITFENAPSGPGPQPISFMKGDVFSVNCIGPGFIWSDVEQALMGFIGNPLEFAFFHLVGSPAPVLSEIEAENTEDSEREPPELALSGDPLVYGYFKIRVQDEGIRSGDSHFVEKTRSAGATANVSIASATPWTQPPIDIVITVTDATADAEKFKYKIGALPEVTDVSFSPGDTGDNAIALGDSGLKASFPAGTYLLNQSWTIRAYPIATVTVSFLTNDGENDDTSFSISASKKLVIDDGSSTGLATGITLAFPAGPYLPGDVFEFDTASEPAKLLKAIAVAAAELMFVMEGVMKRFTFILLEAPADLPDRALVEEVQSTMQISNRVMLSAGGCFLRSPISGNIELRSAGWPIAARLSTAPLHEDLGRVASGPLRNVIAINRDENIGFISDWLAPLDGLGFSTLRTITGLSGFFITAGRMLVPPTSDFRFVQHRRVMDEACRIARILLLQRLNDDVSVNPQTGYITETEASGIETLVNSALRTQLLEPGHVSSAILELSRTDNLLSTTTLTGKVKIVPLGYLRAIEVTIGFNNPALEA